MTSFLPATDFFFIQTSILIDQTNLYAATINAAANAGSSLSTMYDVNNPLAMQLRNVAKMISGGLKTKVYILNINGSKCVVQLGSVGLHCRYDCHCSQLQYFFLLLHALAG